MKKAILFLSIIVASGLVMVTVYNTVVDARSWSSDIPASIQAARDYYKHVDPMHAVPDLRVAGGRLGDGVSLN